MRRQALVDTGLFILRLAVGVIFIAHGLQKWVGAFGGGGITGMVNMLDKIGFVYPVFWAWVVAGVETIGGAFLILGVIPRICSFLIGIIMLVAIFKVHLSNGFFMQQNGFEYQLLILASCILLILVGSGRFSLLNKG